MILNPLKAVLAAASFFFTFSVIHAQDVDPLTGQVQMSIPLWTVNSGDLSAPISLYYSSGGGMKVNAPDSPTGMGWYLSNGGGGVYRDLRGLPDDFVGALSGVPGDLRNGWLHGNNARQVANFVPTAAHDLSTCAGEANDWSTINSFGYTVDTEPDLFSFQAPGLSGKFLFDKNKNVVLMPYQDLKVQVTRQAADSLISQIIITNNQGIQYTFQGGDMVNRTAVKPSAYSSLNYFSSVYNYYTSTAAYYASWNLTEIRSPRGGLLTYAYSRGSTSYNGDFVRVFNSTTGHLDTLYSDTHVTFPWLLQSVTGSNEKATFVYSANTIASVQVNDLTYNTLLKNFNFKYNLIHGSFVAKSGFKPTRNFLVSLTEQVNCNAFPGYTFTYYGMNTNSTNIPFGSDKGQDLFGYYDSTATSLSPEIYAASPDAANGERFRIAPAPGYTLLTTGGGRTVNPAKVFYGALKTINLPAGGTSMIVYEPADYYDAPTNKTIIGGGIRVNKIISMVGDPTAPVTSYSYKLKSGLSSGQWIYRPMFAFADKNVIVRTADNLAPGETILYSRAEVSTTGKGRVVYEYQNKGMYSTTADGDYQATQSLIARNALNGSCIFSGNLKTGYYTFPFSPNTNYDFERGLPLKISYWTNDRKKVTSRKIYTYQRTTLPVASVAGLQFEQISPDIFQFGKYNLLANVNKMSLTETTRTFDQTDTTKFVDKAITYTYNANQMLSQTSTTGSDNSTYSTSFKYAKDYASGGTDKQSQMIYSLVSANRHGSLIETVSYNNGAATGARLTYYDNVFSGSRVLPSKQLTLGNTAGFTPSSITAGLFTKSANYFTSNYIDAYDGLGTPTIVRNRSRQTSSLMMGYNGSAPALEISGARYDQVVYNDFEPSLSTSLTCTGGGSQASTDSWSGNYLGSMTSASVFQQTTVARGVGNYYRFSCWAKASTATTLSVQFYNGTAWVNSTVNYPNAGTTAGGWQYIEQRIDISSVPAGATFSFKLTSSGTITVDNVAFYPETATILAHAFDPMNGKTADLNDRGVAGFIEYDAYGRQHYIKNTDKDIVQIKDYHYQSPQAASPNSHFSFTPQININQSVVFTADGSCVPNVNYSWYVDDVNQNIATTTFTTSFTQNRDYHVRLVASSPGIGSSSTEVIIHPVPVMTISMSNAVNGSQPTCRDSLSHRKFTAALVGNTQASTVTYDWWIDQGTPSEMHWGNGPICTTTLTANIVHTITCYVNITWYNITTDNYDPLSKTSVLTYKWQVADCGTRP